jgi:DNA helicase II / ATP-dependent DNA helicase PcrA
MVAGASELLDGLNKQQAEAVTAGAGPVLVLAGPGSGKTRVLTHRIAYLIREMRIHPSGIMAVTFTNKAAGEMSARVEALLPDILSPKEMKNLRVGTFHAICARLLRREAEHTDRKSDYLIYDTDDQLSVIGQAITELNIDGKKYKPRQMLNHISAAKNELVSAEQYHGEGYIGELTARVYARYQEILVASNARDFDDLIMDTAVLFRDNDALRERYQRFIEYLLVDEFQDTNAAQYFLVRQFGGGQNNIFVVGDEDQAIYGFRGADYRNVLQFHKDFPAAKVILLEQNYRSTQNVLDAAQSVIDKNPHRTRKALFTEQRGGQPLTVFEAYSDTEEAEFVLTTIEQIKRREGLDYKDFAIMYRTNAQSRVLEEACIRESVPYKLVGGVGFYKRREIRDLLAYLRLINNGDDSVSFNRIINVPKRGIGKKSLEDFQQWAAKKRLTFAGAMEALVNGEVSPFNSGTAKKFIEFGQLLEDWRELAKAGDLAVLLDDIIGRIGYTLYLHESSDTTDEALERDENVRELRGLLTERKDEPLDQFLEDIALVADVDSLAEDARNALTLLTLHAAKGLEYPVVFITGLEEGILPHFRSLDEPEGMAEERRLLYVGITRAMRQIFLTYAFRRMMFGESNPSIPSRFLADIPPAITGGMSPRITQERSFNRFVEDTTWDRPVPNERQLEIRSKVAPMPGKPALKYKSGQRVNHAKFGDGMVIESQVKSGDEEVTVSFVNKQHGIKRLAASFANLTILDK